MRTKLPIYLFILALPLMANAEQSSITKADGYSCMGVDHSRKQTENLALQDAKRNAVEFSKTYIESETEMENFQLKKDLVTAFSKAKVKVIDVLNEAWDDPATGDCYTIKIQAEVIPAKAEMQKVVASGAMMEDPRAPLTIKVWTNQDAFKAGEVMKVFLRGNKPFYGRLIYIDASGTKLQILPNPYRKENYFQGGVIYEVPTGNDKFDLTVQEPFGSEKVVLYGSTSPLGQLSTANLGPVLQVKESEKVIAAKTRGITISTERKEQVAEFAEVFAEVKTERKEQVAEFTEVIAEVTAEADAVAEPRSRTTRHDAALPLARASSPSSINKADPNWKQKLPAPEEMTFQTGKQYYWDMDTNMGQMSFRLLHEASPMHVTSTIWLTELGFYDGVVFHRVIPGFMAQGGDPTGTGQGGPGYNYEGEFGSGLVHDRPGLLSMANAGPGTDGSQFFITFVPTPHLNGKHTIFGELVSGSKTLSELEQRGSSRGKTTERLEIISATIRVAKPLASTTNKRGGFGYVSAVPRVFLGVDNRGNTCVVRSEWMTNGWKMETVQREMDKYLSKRGLNKWGYPRFDSSQIALGAFQGEPPFCYGKERYECLWMGETGTNMKGRFNEEVACPSD